MPYAAAVPRLVRDDPDRPDPGLAELYASLPDAVELEPWLGWCREADRVLYLGVGAGRLAVPLVRAGVRLVGVDAHPGMIAHLQRRLPDLELYLARIEDLDLGRSFDLVMAPAGILCHADRLRGAARHACGRVALELVNPHWLLAGAGPGVRARRLEAGRVEVQVSHPGGWVESATIPLVWPEQIEAFLASAGLELCRMQGDGDAGLEGSPTFYVLAARRARRARMPST
ncbi:MAG TPA: class I SAM-dependent methyltransferase [Candidatus Dormibacteraeota bacterium]|nr:class I SAM-dependent methyltransferase [Candidatus Dormibacteraeota bacterium]